LIFRKKIGASCWAGALLALIGVYFLSGAQGLSLAPEDMYLIGCAAAFAFQILFIDLFVKDLDPVRMSAMQFSFCTVYSLLAAFIWEEPTFAMMTSALGSVLYAGIVSGGIGYTLQMIGQKLSDPAPAAILMSLEAVFSAVFGVIMLSQMMSGREILGSCIMLAAVILVQLNAEDAAQHADKNILSILQDSRRFKRRVCALIATGYRADDAYFDFADAFLNNAITLEQLGEAIIT